MRRVSHGKSKLVRFRLRITQGDTVVIGPGKIALLEAIIDAGSITLAARQLGMSYRRAWLLIDEMNRCLRSPAVETAIGGKRGGGTVVTVVGQEIIRLYRQIECKAARAAAQDIDALTHLIPNH